MVRFLKHFSIISSLFFLITFNSEQLFARQVVNQQSPPPTPKPQEESEAAKDKRARKTARRQSSDLEKEASKPVAGAANEEETVEIISDKQSKNADLFLYEGYVNASQGDIRLQADRVTFNNTTSDMVAEGNVIFDQGADQRVTARRAEINWMTKKGRFWETTGFTNRTQTGDYVFFTAARVEKTGPDTFELYDAEVTACEDVIPKWSFKTRHAELKMGDRVVMHNAVFRVKTLPAFVLPYVWIPATRRERKSGFLLPSTGNSNQKGRTLKLAYYQTLGESADITFRGDIYTQRGIGMGAEFRAQTDENSYLRLGVFSVKDRIFGPAGENQGGTAFSGEGVQYLGHGWLAVGNVSLVSSLAFRQIFSDDIAQVIDPRRESTFYANNNTGGFSFNFLAANETTTLFRPSRNPLTPADGTNVDIKIRQAPEINMTLYPQRVFDSIPIYFSFDANIGALKREETIDTNVTLVTPAAVQRLDFQPKITVPLRTVAGLAITPSLTLRETFYNSSLDPNVPAFDPEQFTLDSSDPRLNPARVEFRPGLKLFDRNRIDPISLQNISRLYIEGAVEIRPPGLEKTYTNQDGTPKFKHLIEPYITYRVIRGIGDEFNKIIRFDDRDAVANTNEFEYALVNRFFTRRSPSDLTRRRSMVPRVPQEMKPVNPDTRDKGDRDKEPSRKPADKVQPPVTERPVEPADTKVNTDQKQAPRSQSQLESGEKAELNPKDRLRGQAQEPKKRAGDEKEQSGEIDGADATPQAYEALTVKVAQKYFFDRNFGGALIEGRRNQFYPINTLSGFTFGGRAREFSPVNLAVRYRPLSAVYADLRMDVSRDDGVRNVTLGAGIGTDKLTVSAHYYLSRQIKVEANGFEAGTFPGDQISTTVQWGNNFRGLYGGSRVSYDFTNRFISDSQVSRGRLMNSRSYVGYAWDCCGVQFNYNTFKAGLRNESAWSVTFNLAGLGSYGTDQFSQLGGGRGASRGRKGAKRLDDFP